MKIESKTYENITCTVQSQTRELNQQNMLNSVYVYDTTYQMKLDIILRSNSLKLEYEYRLEETPEITSVFPLQIKNLNTTIQLNGTRIRNATDEVSVSIGGVKCHILSIKDDGKNLECLLEALEAGKHNVALMDKVHGVAVMNLSSPIVIVSQAIISTIQPIEGSTHGGTEITIEGHGFHKHDSSVSFGSSLGKIISITPNVIKVISPQGRGAKKVIVKGKQEIFPGIAYTYDIAVTPLITSISPAHGAGGNSVTLSGSAFSNSVNDLLVHIGGISCNVTSTKNV